MIIGERGEDKETERETGKTKESEKRAPKKEVDSG